MKVLLLLPHAGAGGDIVVVRALARELSKHGHFITCAGALGGAPLDGAASVIEIPLNRGAIGLLRSVCQFQYDHYDVVHAHSPIAALLGTIIRFRLGGRLIFSAHLHTAEAGIRRWMKRLLLRSMDLVICVSDETQDRMIRQYTLAPQRCRVIHNGASEERFFPPADGEREALRAKWEIDAGARVLGFVGRLHPDKNLPMLFRYLAKHRHDAPDLVLLIAGEGPIRAELEQQVRDLGIGSHVRFLGHLKDTRAVHLMSNLCVLPSINESFALVIIEAFLCGVPALRSNLGGSTAQIVPWQTGLTFQAGDDADFDRQLTELLADPARLRQMGKNARKLALLRFTEQAMCDAMERSYLELVSA